MGGAIAATITALCFWGARMPIEVAYLVAMNVCSFITMGHDKQAAMTGGDRTPELVLGLWALLGGSVGTFAAMKFFRHKTEKARFHFIIGIALVLQVVALKTIVSLP